MKAHMATARFKGATIMNHAITRLGLAIVPVLLVARTKACIETPAAGVPSSKLTVPLIVAPR